MVVPESRGYRPRSALGVAQQVLGVARAHHRAIGRPNAHVRGGVDVPESIPDRMQVPDAAVGDVQRRHRRADDVPHLDCVQSPNDGFRYLVVANCQNPGESVPQDGAVELLGNLSLLVQQCVAPSDPLDPISCVTPGSDPAFSPAMLSSGSGSAVSVAARTRMQTLIDAHSLTAEVTTVVIDGLVRLGGDADQCADTAATLHAVLQDVSNADCTRTSPTTTVTTTATTTATSTPSTTVTTTPTTSVTTTPTTTEMHGKIGCISDTATSLLVVNVGGDCDTQAGLLELLHADCAPTGASVVDVQCTAEGYLRVPSGCNSMATVLNVVVERWSRGDDAGNVTCAAGGLLRHLNAAGLRLCSDTATLLNNAIASRLDNTFQSCSHNDGAPQPV